MTAIHQTQVRPLIAKGRWQLSAELSTVADAWSAAAPLTNRFLQLPYLRALAAAPPRGVVSRYAVYLHAGRPAGVVLIQRVTFWAAKNIKQTEQPTGLRQRMYKGMRQAISQKAAFHTLTCGNFLLSGQHGFYFDADLIPTQQQLALVEEAMVLAQASLASDGYQTDGFFVKDIETRNADAARHQLGERQFHEVNFQPNMVLNVRPEWHTRNDYLAAMSSKYRVRARKVAKQATAVRRVVWSATVIADRRKELHKLYRSVAEHADFNLLHLTEDYLPSLADELGSAFRLTAYLLDGVLVGFRTTIDNYSSLEAHFLGYDAALKNSHRLYQNMLYDLIEEAIEGHYGTLIYARTALEIKSSVGAEPEELISFLRHDKRWANCLLPRVFDYLAPKMEWTQRHPFKR